MDKRPQNGDAPMSTTGGRPRKGSIVRVVFLDHVEDGDELMECTVYGRLAGITRKEYQIDSWCCKDPKCHEDNKKRFTLARSTFIDVAILVPKGNA